MREYTREQLTRLRTTRAKIGAEWERAEQHYQREYGDIDDDWVPVEFDEVISFALSTRVAEFVENWRSAHDNQIRVLRGRQVRRQIPTEHFEPFLDMLMDSIHVPEEEEEEEDDMEM